MNVGRKLGFSRNAVKYIAYVTMFMDHIGYLFFNNLYWMRMIGRMAFPLFAYLIADGMRRTRQPEKLLLRLAVFAVVSQPPFSLVTAGTPFSWGYLNIFFTLLMGTVICYFIREKDQYTIGVQLFLLLLSILLILVSGPLNMDYQSYGVLLITGFYILQSPRCLPSWTPPARKVSLFLFLSVMSVYSLVVRNTNLQCSAPVAALFLPCDETQPSPRHRWDRWMYLIFPGHLILLWLMMRFT